jgi:hypothetical protein
MAAVGTTSRPATLVFGRHWKRIGRASLRLQFLSPMRGKYVARRLRGQPVDRTAPDGSRFDYLHVSPAGAPLTLLGRHHSCSNLLALFYDIGNLVALGVDDDDLAIAYKKLVGPQSRDLL